MSEGKRYKWTREKMVPVEWGPYMNYLDHLAALRRAKAEGVREASKMADEYGAEEWSNTCVQDGMARLSLRLDARAAKIEEGEG